MNDNEKICLISGRFDMAHCGHIKTITDLGQRFRKVIVVVLDHAEQRYPISYRTKILREILANSRGSYEVIANKYHFGKISIDALMEYSFDVYAGGNLSVLKHLEKICAETNIEFLYVDRPYEISSTTERIGSMVREMV